MWCQASEIAGGRDMAAKTEWAYICSDCGEWVNKANRVQHGMRDAFQAATHEMYAKEMAQLLVRFESLRGTQ